MKNNPYLNEHLVVVVLSFTLLIIGTVLHFAYELYNQAIALVAIGLTIPFGENFIIKDNTNHPYKKVTTFVFRISMLSVIAGTILTFVFNLEVIGIILAMAPWLLITAEKYARTQGRYEISNEYEDQ